MCQYRFLRAQQALAPCTRRRWALPPAPPLGAVSLPPDPLEMIMPGWEGVLPVHAQVRLYVPVPLSTGSAGAGALHPRWGK
jgi:hypothetical protein